MKLRKMTTDDYEQVYQLWLGIDGFGIRSLDDSREGIAKFINRNPETCVVAEVDGQIVGNILCGHDGRRACFYHVCVAKPFRKKGIASKMVGWCRSALAKEGIHTINLVAFKQNQSGNCFWRQEGWTLREDINYYDKVLNKSNITEFVALAEDR